MHRPFSYLSTFNDGEPATQPPAAAPSPPAAPDTVPVSALPHILKFVTSEQAKPAAAPPAAAPPAPPKPERDRGREEQDRRIRALELERYRDQAFARANASGQQYVAAMVFGASEAEIDASLQAAIAQHAQIAEQLKAQHQAEFTAEQERQRAEAQTKAKEEQDRLNAEKAAKENDGVPASTLAAPPEGAPPSLPGASNPPSAGHAGTPAGSSIGIDRGQLQKVTETKNIRNGVYAQNREQIFETLKGQMGGPGAQWTFQQHVPVAPVGAAGRNLPSATAVQAGPGGTQIPAASIVQPTGAPQAHRQGVPDSSAPPIPELSGAPINISAAREAAAAAVAAGRTKRNQP